MPNINVPIQLEKIRAGLSKVANHIGEHSGIDARHARSIENAAVEIATLGFQIAALALEVQGDRNAPENVLKILRQAVDV